MPETYPRIVFLGAHFEALSPLKYLISAKENVCGVVTLDAAALQGMSGGANLVKPAERAGIPVAQIRNINDPESVDRLRALAPDILLVIGWTQLLREHVLAVANIACLGFHASLLPRYRGRAPVNWAILNGEQETGNTMMVLEPGADEGDIVAQRRIPITLEDDCRTVYQKVAATEVDMLREVLPLIRRGQLPRRKQDRSTATVMRRRRPEDGLIDWTQSASRLYDWVRAQTHPYPGAFTVVGGQKVFIWRAALGPGTPELGTTPGLVALDEDRWPLICTGDGWLRLLSVQREGNRERPAREVAADLLRPGTLLGR